MFTTVLLAIVTLILIIYLTVKRNTGNAPPGPFPWPFFGNLFLLKRLTRELGGQAQVFLELSKRYASDVIQLTIGNDKVLVVSGFKLCETILKSHEFEGRPWNEFIKIRNMGKKQGISMNDGTEWKILRNWMMRAMKNFGFGKREMIELTRNELITLLDSMNKKGPLRLKILITRPVMNVLWFLTSGQAFSTNASVKYFVDLVERRSRAFDMTGGFLTAFPWIRYIAPELSGYNLLCTLNNELKDFLMKTIAEHKTNYKPGSEADVIDMFLNEMENNEESNIFTDGQLVAILVDVFLAGFSTTSTALDFLFLSMIVYQDVQRKVQEEIDSVIPRDRLPEIEDKAKLPYVQAVIDEVYRLWPVFPIIGPRRVLNDTTRDKYTIPKDTTVLINLYSINKDPNLYPEPDKFMPERFMKNGAYESDAHSLEFGKGKRRCPGEVLAKSAIFMLFAGVMQKYSLFPIPGKGPYSVEVIYGLTSSPKPYEALAVPR